MKWSHLTSNLDKTDDVDDVDEKSGFYYGSNLNKFISPHQISSEKGVSPSKIASFDLDSTLIKTKTGYTFPKDADDWKWFSPNVPNMLKTYFSKGYRIMIITNQGRLKNNQNLLSIFRNKVDQIEQDLMNRYTDSNINFEVICLNYKNVFRKPYPTVIDLIFPNGLTADSFYCGDAAGRPSDHSDSDATFAYNSFMRFCTPEQLFLKKYFDKSMLNISIRPLSMCTYRYSHNPKNRPELIIMVGYPGSGKSHITKKIIADSLFSLESYDEFCRSKHITVLSLDNLKTRPRLYGEMKNIIYARQSMIIDNTSLSSDDRTKLIQILEDCGCRSEYVVRVILIKRNMEDSYRLNCYRLYRNHYTDSKFIPHRVYKMMRAKLVEPNIDSEDIDIIDEVVPGDPNDIAYYFHYE